MDVYYNEIDPYCAAWLQNLMDAGQIPHGVIDTRSIEDVRPDELAGFTQCHFFAGLGGWAYALQLAGWGARPVWTGSCPCQPFSAAGKGAGFADERHLWPAWQHLIAQCRPTVIFGEQVASKAVEPWIDLVHADMEGMGYAFGCVPFPSAGIGAPHIRDRNYWVADADSAGWQQGVQSVPAGHVQPPWSNSQLGGVEHASGHGLQGRLLGGANSQRQGEHEPAGRDSAACGLADSNSTGCIQGNGNISTSRHRHSATPARGNAGFEFAGPTNGLWRAADWLRCRDGKWRPVEPGTFPMADGLSNRVGRLRAYGNAINAEAAAAFIRSYCEA